MSSRLVPCVAIADRCVEKAKGVPDRVRRRRHQETAVTALGRKVRSLRGAKGWSQERLAELADLDRSYIAGIEVGARNPSVKALERLAAALSVRLSELFEE